MDSKERVGVFGMHSPLFVFTFCMSGWMGRLGNGTCTALDGMYFLTHLMPGRRQATYLVIGSILHVVEAMRRIWVDVRAGEGQLSRVGSL